MKKLTCLAFSMIIAFVSLTSFTIYDKVCVSTVQEQQSLSMELWVGRLEYGSNVVVSEYDVKVALTSLALIANPSVDFWVDVAGNIVEVFGGIEEGTALNIAEQLASVLQSDYSKPVSISARRIFPAE